MSTYVADKRLQWARGLPVLSLFGVCTLLESKILKIIYVNTRENMSAK